MIFTTASTVLRAIEKRDFIGPYTFFIRIRAIFPINLWKRVRTILPAINSYEYRAFGFPVVSEMPLPELEPAFAPAIPEEAIYIGFEDLSSYLKEMSFGRNIVFIHEDAVLIKIEEAALFRVSNGNRITCYPLPGADMRKIKLYLLGTCMAALLFQRRILPLHGSAIAINGRAYAFVGNSGAGKSTLAAAFLAQGFHLVSDDVIGVPAFSQGEPPCAIPAYPQQKLWSESLTQFGMEKERYQQLHREAAKFAVPVATRFQQKPLPLAGVFELTVSSQADILIRPIIKLEKVDTLTKHTYRQFLVQMLDLEQWHFDSITALAGKVPVYRIRRPSDGFTANRLAGQILQIISEGEG